MKPLEACAASPGEFRELCYLLTCQSVQEVVREWQGAAAAREELLQLSGAMLALQADQPQAGAAADDTGGCLLDAPLPQRRLLTLLQQAAEKQVEAASRRALWGAANEVAPTTASASNLAHNRQGMDWPGAAEGAADAGGGHVAASAREPGSGEGQGGLGCGGGQRLPPPRAAQLGSLLSDYTSPLLPNAPRHTLVGHTGGVKCLAWLALGNAPDQAVLASGGNDATVRLWRLGGGTAAGGAPHAEGGAGKDDATHPYGAAGTSSEGGSRGAGWCACILPHPGRVWALSARPGGEAAVPLLASACADGRVRLYHAGEALAGSNTAGGQAEGGAAGTDGPGLCFIRHTLGSHDGDAYAVVLHPREPLCLSAGYDGTVRLYDLFTGVHLRSLVGHARAVTAAAFNGAGNLVASGGKDASIRFWDLRSGLCIKTLGAPLGEVSSVDLAPNGVHLLSSSRDNAIRIWDVRSTRPLRSLKGHQNTARNFVRAAFARGGGLASSGSEDGAVYLWDVESGQLAARLPGHSDVVYEARWCDTLSLLASASHDGVVRTWAHDRSRDAARLLLEDPWMGAAA